MVWAGAVGVVGRLSRVPPSKLEPGTVTVRVRGSINPLPRCLSLSPVSNPPSLLQTVQLGKAQEGNGSNHAVSSMKFRILRMFLELGYSVFLSGTGVPAGRWAGLHFVGLIGCRAGGRPVPAWGCGGGGGIPWHRQFAMATWHMPGGSGGWGLQNRRPPPRRAHLQTWTSSP